MAADPRSRSVCTATSQGRGPTLGRGGFQLGDQLDLYRRARRQRRNAHRRPCVPALFAKHRDEQIGRTVDDLRLRGEFIRAIHKAGDLNDAFYMHEIADFGLQHRDELQRTRARDVSALRLAQFATYFTGEKFSVSASRDLSGEKYEISAAHRGYVVGDCRRYARELEPQRRKFLLGRCGISSIQNGERAKRDQSKAQECFHKNYSLTSYEFPAHRNLGT